MMRKSTMTLMVAWLLALMLVFCGEDGKPEAVDPCPGWPAFKVGNGWTYLITSDNIPFGDTIEVVADSIIEIANKKYLRLMDIDPKQVWFSMYIRCTKDIIYNYTRGICEECEYKWVDLSLNKGEGWYVIMKTKFSKTDTFCYISVIDNNKIIKDIDGKEQIATIFNLDYYQGPQFDRYTVDNEIGIISIEHNSLLFSSKMMLISFNPIKKE